MVHREEFGYPVESHNFKTADNYILTLTRIPGPKKETLLDRNEDGLSEKRRKPAVLIVPGMFASAEHWLINDPDKALPFRLVMEGYDCWIATCRGAFPSRGHAEITTESRKYWDFSWHEMAFFDIPSMIDYILETTGNTSLYYIGHSLGATIGLLSLALRPTYCSKLTIICSLAPGVHAKHVQSLSFRLIVPLGNLMAKSEFIRTQEILNEKFADWVRSFWQWARSSKNVGAMLIKSVCARFGMFGTDQIEEARMAMIAERCPAATSMKVICHGLQTVTSGIFRQYDYGSKANLKLYGQVSPPVYDFSKVNVPVATFYSDSDELCTPKDIANLSNQLPNSIGLFGISQPKFSHVDFMFGKDANKLVYDRVIKIFREVGGGPLCV